MRTAGLFILAALFPATLHADGGRSVRFNNYCTTGALVTCASVSISVTAREGGGTILLIAIQNLQGTHPADNTAGSLITGIDINFPNVPYLEDSTTDDDTGPTGNWSAFVPGTNNLDGGQGYGGPIFDWWFASNLVAWNGVQTFSGVAGCTPPPVGHVFPAMGEPWIGATQTCRRFGAPGALIFRFETPVYDWAGEDFQVGWDVADLNGNTSCWVGRNCFATATPEPATLILTSTGLSALAAVRWRRKHRL